MQPVTPAFAAAVRSSHRVITRADLWYAGTLVAADLAVTAGTCTIDDDADIRTSARLTVADPFGRLLPVAADMARLSVYGHEVQLRQGLALTPHGRVELVSLGWLRVQNVKATERWRRRDGVWVSGGAELEVEALDRWARLDDDRLLAPEQPAAGATCLAEIRRLVAGRIPLATWPAVPDAAVPADLVYEESRTDAIRALASAANVKCYVDRNGNFTLRPREVAGGAHWVLTGDPDGALTGIESEWSRDGVYNAVVARGETEADSAPVQAYAYETDPGSPTRWDGPFGRVPTFYASPLLTSTAAAQAAATTRLQTVLAGRDRVVTLSAVPNPAAEPGTTVVAATTPRETVTGRLVSLELPLAPSGGSARVTIRVAPTTPTRVASHAR